MNIKVIKYESSRYYELLELRDELLRKPLGLKFQKEDLDKEFNQIHIAYIINNKIVGGLILVPSKNVQIKMRQVCVSKNMQGKGIGKKLVFFAEKYALKKGFKEMYCHARKNALNFYMEQEYEIEGDVFTEVGLEHYKLVKKINYASLS